MTQERRAVVEEAWPLPAVVVAYHITYDGHPDSYPLHVTSKILSDGQSARISRELIYNRRLCLTAFGSGNITEHPNLFFAVCIVQPGQTPEAAEKALIAEFDKLKTEGVTEQEMQRSQNQWARDYILSRESNEDKAMHLAHAAVIHNDITTADGEFDIFMKTTAADVQRVARTYFNDTNRVVLHILAQGDAPMKRRVLLGGRTLAGPAGRGLRGVHQCGERAGLELAVRAPPQPLPARDVKFPPYEVRTLANGLQVITVAHHEQPAVSMRMVVRAGSVQDPPGKAGVANLTGSLLDQGTTTKSAQQIADQIDFIGGALGTGSGSDLSFVNVIVMKDSFGVGDGPAVRRRSEPRVRRRGDRAAEAAGDVVAAGQRRGSRLHRRRACSIGWCTASTPTDCRTAVRRRRWPRSRAPTFRRITGAISCPTT